MRTVESTVDIVLVTVAAVDNEGADCPVCDEEGAQVQANVYVPQTGGRSAEVKDACLRCVVPVVRDSAAEGRILVEVAK